MAAPLRLTALFLVVWCAGIPGCNGGNRAVPERDEAAGVSGASSSAGQTNQPAGAPVAGAEGGEDAGPDEPLPAAEAGAGHSSGGEPGIVADASAGAGTEAGAPPVTTVVPPPPSCGKQLSGASCGLNMSPPGLESMRYFCFEGAVMAQARCPGTCDLETNACAQGGGTGGGTGGASINTVLRCRACYANTCRPQLVACDKNPLCVAHLDCYDSCQLDSDCYLICNEAFAHEPLFDDLNACVGKTNCAGQCPAP